MDSRTHYDILGVGETATVAEIKRRYRELARQYHPDVAKTREAEAQFRQINEAYRVLSDTGRRMTYDAELKLAGLKRPKPAPAPPPSGGPAGDPGGFTTRGGSWQSPGRPQAGAARPVNPQRPRRAPSEEFVSRAKAALSRLRLRDAESFCRQALRHDRRNPAAYEILGDIYISRGRTDEAIAMYSYALQLDRDNFALRQKFDRLVGQPSGPTMAGHAAASKRRGNRPIYPIAPRLMSMRALFSGAGIVACVFLLASVALDKAPPAPSAIPLEWPLEISLSLAATGLLGGLLFAVNGLIGRCKDELATQAGKGGRGHVPVGSVLLAFSLLFFYASFVVYTIISFLQASVSVSILRAFAVSFAIVALFAFVSHASATFILISGGNIVFLMFVVGWIIGDLFRPDS